MCWQVTGMAGEEVPVRVCEVPVRVCEGVSACG